MIRVYTNVSTSPDVKVPSVTPTILGTRIRPGDRVQLNDQQWDELDDETKRRLERYVEDGAFGLEYENMAGASPSSDEPVAAVADTEETTVTDSENEPVDTDDDSEETSSASSGEDESKESDTSEEDESKDLDESETDADTVVDDDFDYAAFLNGSVAEVKEAYQSLESPPAIAAVIEHERNGDNRSTLIEWLEQRAGE